MKKPVLCIVFLTLSFLFTPYFIVPVHAGEPPLGEVLEHLGFTNIEEVETTDVTFPAGMYSITLYAEFAGYHNTNELSYYQAGTNTYNLIFAGPEGGFGYLSPPITKTVISDHEFGLSMFVSNEDHRYFTENSLNPDGQRHCRVYKNLDDPLMFLVGFENLYGGGDRDFQDIVVSLELQTPHQSIPEVPFGTILGLLSMTIAMIGFVGFRRFRQSFRRP